jgi:prophage maintenance system killer protein
MDVESSAIRLGGDFATETLNSSNSNTTQTNSHNNYSQNADPSQVIKTEDDPDMTMQPQIYTPSILKNTPYVDLCNIPNKIEFINLIDPKEDYTLHTFHLGRANLENNSKVARKCTFKFEQLEKIEKIEKMENSAKIEKIEKNEKIRNYEEINLIDSSEEESEEMDEYNLKRGYKYGAYSNRRRKSRLKINTKMNSHPSHSYTKNLRRENILVYSSDNKYETCDILWINTVDDEVLPSWKVCKEKFFK